MSAPSTSRDIAAGDLIVVGGGLIGLTSALAVAARGLRVTLVDRAAGPGAEASGAAAGIVSLLYPWQYPASVQALARYSRERYPYWYSKFMATGLLSFDRAPAGFGEPLDDARVAELVPGIVPPHADGATWLADVGAVEPRFFAATLAARAADAEITLRWGAEVAAVAAGDGAVRGVVLANGTVLTAPRVLIATGAWSAALLAPLGVRVPVHPVRGQLIEFSGAHGVLNTIVTHEHHYLVPRGDGRIVAGSTAEEVGFDPGVTPSAADELQRFAGRLVPALAALPVARQWSGLRPASPDGVPLIGPVADVEGLWLNLGHFRNGITLAPGSAELVAARIAGAAPMLDPAPFDRLYFATPC